MSGDFLDSNVFLYMFDPVNDKKRSLAEEVVNSALDSNACISFQVVQEVLNRLSKPDVEGEGVDLFRVLREVLDPFWRVMPSEDLYTRALELRARFRFSFYDSLIIAAALEAGCDRLFSEDLQHGQRIEGLTIVNPFITA